MKRDIKPPYHYYPCPEPIPDFPVISVTEAVDTLLNPEWTGRVLKERTVTNLRDVFEAVLLRSPDFKNFYQMVFTDVVIKEADLRDLDLPFSLVFQGDYFLEHLVLNRASFASLSIESSYVCGALSLVEVKGQPGIGISTSQIDDLRLYGGSVSGLHLRGVRLGGFSLADCAVKGGVSFHDQSEVRDSFFIERVEATDAVEMVDTELHQAARIRDTRCQRLALTSSLIQRDLTVERSEVVELDLKGTTFDGFLDLRGLQFQRIDATAIHGEGVFWLEEAQLRGQRRGWWLPKYDTPSKIMGDGALDRPSVAKAAEQLFLLREKFHRVPSMYPQEDYCAYRLMEASRALATGRFQKGILLIAKWCCGYLILPARILLTMIATIAVSGGIYAAVTLGSPGTLLDASRGVPMPIGAGPMLAVVAECLYFSAITFVTLSFGIVPVGIARVAAMAEALLGLVLVSLLTVSLARRALRW